MLIRSAPGSAPLSPELHRRLTWIIVTLTVAFLVLIARLWQLQVLRGDEYFEAARSNVVDQRFLPSVRGEILDRNGRPLATNRPAFNIYVIPREFDGERLRALTRLLGLDDEERQQVEERVAAGRSRGASLPVMVLEDQGRDRAALIAQSRLQLPGVEVRDEPWRYYPHGKLAAHLLGYMNQLNEAELAELESLGYHASEYIGRYGLEKQFENYLRGKKGIERFVVNAKGERIDRTEAESLIEGPRFVPPVAGHNVVLTLDLELQELVERALGQHAAAAVAVVGVDTGRLLALASTPSFDPNVMTGKLTRAEEALLLSDPRKPFLDKTLRRHYPPGSTYKFVTALAVLEDEAVDPHEQVFCSGRHELGRRVFHCHGSHGRLDLLGAIQHSCNVYFWKVAERVGIDRLASVAHDFGFGAPSGLGLNGDEPGRVPTRAWYEERETFKIGYTLNTAVGQGDVTVTVVQLAMAYAAVANGGRLYAPQVVRRVETPGGDVVADYEPVLRRTVDAGEKTLEELRRGMWMVVNDLGGTAYEHARTDVVELAGKTGTAQVRSRRLKPGELEGWHPHRPHAWFAGFAPADDPEIAIVVLIEHGGSGGKFAGPVAREIVEGYFEMNQGEQGGEEQAPEEEP